MRVMRLLAAIALFLMGFLPAAAQIEPGPKVAARLIAERSIVAPGERVPVAFELKMKPGWHTYWINPGEAGAPTELKWKLPQGWQAAEIEWPYPKRLPVGPLMDYGYEGTVWLLTAVQAPQSAKSGDITLNATGNWLVCREVCIPEDANLSLKLTVAEQGIANPVLAQQFAAARAKLPQVSPWLASYRAGDDKTLDIFLESPTLASARPVAANFFPLSEGMINGFTEQKLGIADNGIVLRTEPGRKFSWRKFRSTEPELPGVIVLTSADGSVKALSIRAEPGAVPAARFVSTAPAAGVVGLPVALIFAFLGGLILNLMPCVLPVLAMKAFAVAQASHGHPQEAPREGLAYGAGAILSFLVLGAAVVLLRAGGQAVGWGFQLQEPIVVAGFALLMFAVGLNLSGVYELSSGVTAGDALTRKGGAIGAFFTGILAVAVAAPCTAPFMAAALGYAITQSAVVAMAVFLALGLGFALPFVAIGLSPALLRLIPRPGAWMLRFKQALAFPMYGAAVWLVWVLALQTGAGGVLAALAAMVLFAFGAWVWGASRDAGVRWRSMANIFSVLAFLSALTALWFVKTAAPHAVTVQISEDGLHSEPYSAARLDALRAQNRPVFVNATAAWCITCLVNEKVAFSADEVVEAFAKNKVAYLVADWTNRNPEITKLLEANARSGVPLYLYYAPGASTPKVLPQVLTASEVVSAIGGK
ncbi:MAG TPA: protein-disulfide reductase DsbD domain-containing protein [Rhizomicrobium sp.]|nr:protein-disulfide reductase DsbD domain-containing protein [Rhizomicrobium sp.]